MSSSDFRFATVSGPHVDWVLKRNCSVTPAQLGWMYASLCAVSLGIAGMFWLHGARYILGFAWLELLAVGAAFLVYARHATDGERISLRPDRLVVEQVQAGRVERVEFDRAWVRVEPRAADGSLIEVSGRGRKVTVGRHVRAELRADLAREIRRALHGV